MSFETELTTLIGSYGFPIAVTMWLLFERATTLKAFTNAINKLSLLIESRIK